MIQRRSKYSQWTAEQLDYIKDNYEHLSSKQMGEELGMSSITIRTKIHQLRKRNILKKDFKVERLTAHEIAFLKKSFRERSSTEEVAVKLNKSCETIDRAIKRHILRTPKQCLEIINSGFFGDWQLSCFSRENLEKCIIVLSTILASGKTYNQYVSDINKQKNDK